MKTKKLFFIIGILIEALSHPLIASANPVSSMDWSYDNVRAKILSAIPMTSPYQQFEGVSQNGNKCIITISFETYPQKYLSISGIEYVMPGYQGDYHYFQMSEGEVADNLSDRSKLVFSVTFNSFVQKIGIVGNSDQRAIAISDKKGIVQCRINLNYGKIGSL